MTHKYEILLALGVLSPFISFWLLVFFGPRLGKPKAGWVAVLLGMGVPLALATVVLFGWLGEVRSGNAAALTEQAFRVTWARLGDVPVTFGVKLDSLTVAMYFMVTFIAFWIFVFSVGYMSGHSDEVAHQCKYWRFFAYLSLFGFSMLGLVISSSLFFLFVFWELVGLCSYLLIGFYFDRPYASAAAIKAFVVNRVGDFGFLIGLMLVYFQLGTLDLDGAARAFSEQAAAGTGIFASSFTLFGWSLATIMGVGLFCGAMGKSAQFPLHVWLPDAMAGPTPVSALIHAATMVAAGVYLVARVFRLMTPDALMFVAVIGCLTLTLMALVAIVQTDIKKCLAYSTLSQLGYMIFGMGCGAWIAALFHLITHAFFKAMLFLGSGQVIEGCHHEQDMRKMGGLRRKMPVTCWTFFVGVLAISGAGIAGFQIGDLKFGLGGFFSKDEILAVAYARAFEWDEVQKLELGGHGEHAAGGATKRRGDEAPERGAALAAFQESSGHKTVWVQTEELSKRLEGADPQQRMTIIGLELGFERTEREQLHWRPEHVPFDPSGYDERRAVGLLRLLEPQQAAELLQLLPEPMRWRLSAALAASVRADAHPGTDAIAALQTHVGAPHAPGPRHSSHDAGGGMAAIFGRTAPLPRWMFWLALATAYITPFYMMRAWWMTFMGKPRDEHVHHHAHEIPLMYVPLAVLAVGTLVASYFVFRPLMSDAAKAATVAPMVLALDGESHIPAIASAHHFLMYGVGGAFLVGFAIAIAIYRNGLGLAERIRRVAGPLHTLLVHKYYFDEVYDLIWVKGCVLVANIARFIDTWIVDLVFNLAATVTERFAAFTGLIIDNHGVDGFVNGVSKTSMDFSGLLRSPQTGRIRRYVLITAAVATAVLAVLAWFGLSQSAAAAM